VNTVDRKAIGNKYVCGILLCIEEKNCSAASTGLTGAQQRVLSSRPGIVFRTYRHDTTSQSRVLQLFQHSRLHCSWLLCVRPHVQRKMRSPSLWIHRSKPSAARRLLVTIATPRIPQTVIEKVVQKYAVGLPEGKVVKAGDYVMIRPEHVMTHDNTGPVVSKCVV